MGTAASSTTRVQRISINANGESFKSSGRLSSAGGRSVTSIVSGRLLRSAGSIGSKSSLEKERKLANLQSQLEGADKKLGDAEDLIRSLQRELCSLEMKNFELSEEVSWLKGQIGALPESGPIAICSGNIYKSEQQARQSLTEMYQKSSEDLENLKTKYQTDKNIYENTIKNLQDELKNQIERYQKKLKFEEELNEKLEDLVRKELGETFLYNFKNSLARDTPVPTYADAKPMCRNFLPSGGRLSTPQLNGHINNPNSRPNSTPPSTASSTASNRIFTSATARRVSLEKQISEEIDAIIESTENTETIEEELPEPPLPPRTANDVRKATEVLPKYAENMRQVTPPQKPNRTMLSQKVFTLSETMEPIRLLDNNPVPFSNRPATADTVSSAHMIKAHKNSHDSNEQRDYSPMNRGSSVPMLFRPSKSRENRRKHKSSSIAPISYDIESFDEAKDDDEVYDILNESIPSLNNFPRGRTSAGKFRDRDSLSAKSRDSGYLGESTIANHIEDLEENS